MADIMTGWMRGYHHFPFLTPRGARLQRPEIRVLFQPLLLYQDNGLHATLSAMQKEYQ